MQQLGHSVTGYDSNPINIPDISITEKLVSDADITFLSASPDEIPALLENLVENGLNGPYVVRSSAVPGTTQVIMFQYGVHICHNPELVWKNNTKNDERNEKTIVRRVLLYARRFTGRVVFSFGSEDCQNQAYSQRDSQTGTEYVFFYHGYLS